MRRRIAVARVAEIPPGTGKHIETDEHVIAVFNHGGRFYALEGTCPHQGGPLGEGYLDERGIVTCPWHAWQFRVTDGESPDTSALFVRTYAVEIEGDEIVVTVSAGDGDGGA